MIVVSNSEVESYQRCPQAHWYGYGLGLTPTKRSMPLKAGILGHEVMQHYYEGKKAGLTHPECIQRGMAVLLEYMKFKGEDTDDGKVLPIVTKRFLEYTRYYKNEPWRVIDVEGVYNIPLGHGITYALTLDLLVEITDGKYKGEQAVVDHKWTYNFWSQDDIFMNAQVPKYIWTLGKLGSNARIGFLNQVRYREFKSDQGPENLFRRTLIEHSQRRMDNIMAIQGQMAMQIANLKLMGKETLKDRAVRAIHKQNCSTCFFRDPCSIELDGRDSSTTLAANFAKNTYGYNEAKLRRNLE